MREHPSCHGDEGRTSQDSSSCGSVFDKASPVQGTSSDTSTGTTAFYQASEGGTWAPLGSVTLPYANIRPVHMTAEQVYAQVHEALSGVSRATVYNTLGLFCEKRLLRELLVDPQRIVYDSNTTPHFHLYNADTGAVTDISAEQMQVLGTPSLPAVVALEEVDVIIRVRNQQA